MSTFFESDDVVAKKVRQKAQIMTALSISSSFSIGSVATEFNILFDSLKGLVEKRSQVGVSFSSDSVALIIQRACRIDSQVMRPSLGRITCESIRTPQTPYQRLMACSYLTEKEKERLKQMKENLDPFKLERGLESHLRIFFSLLKQSKKEVLAA